MKQEELFNEKCSCCKGYGYILSFGECHPDTECGFCHGSGLAIEELRKFIENIDRKIKGLKDQKDLLNCYKIDSEIEVLQDLKEEHQRKIKKEWINK